MPSFLGISDRHATAAMAKRRCREQLKSRGIGSFTHPSLIPLYASGAGSICGHLFSALVCWDQVPFRNGFRIVTIKGIHTRGPSSPGERRMQSRGIFPSTDIVLGSAWCIIAHCGSHPGPSPPLPSCPIIVQTIICPFCALGAHPFGAQRCATPR